MLVLASYGVRGYYNNRIMSDQDFPKDQPYAVLGKRLRIMRQKCKESAAEVSGAVEIDIDTLERYERGLEVPSEDILMLLINHFGLGDDEAVSLWEMAGYDQHDMFCDHDHSQDDMRPQDGPRMVKQPIVLLAMDTRVVYTNGAEVVADKNGVVLSFTQFTDANQGPVPVARVGMSYEQAGQVLETLQRTLLHAKYAHGPKALPHSTENSDPQNKDVQK